MAGILSKSKAKGVDFCGGYTSHYIIRSDLGCYMSSSDLHEGYNLTIHSIHPTCQGGDHYFADTSLWYIIKGNSYRTVTDLSNDSDPKVFTLHPNCRGGDHYLFAGDSDFYIIFQSRGVYRRTPNLTDGYGTEYSLLPNCRDGLYYWGNADGFHLVKPKNEWGIEFQRSNSLGSGSSFPPNTEKFSFHSDVMNFLPGGLAITQGPAFGKWHLIRTINPNPNSPLTWERRIARKVGYTWSKSTSIEHNWKVSVSTTYQSGALTESLVRQQFSFTTEYGGTHVNSNSQSWSKASDIEEKVKLILQPNKKVYVWQFKLGFRDSDVLFCRDLLFDNNPNPPTDIPLPPSNM